MSSSKEIFDTLDRALDEIRPFLRQDGGDVELIQVTDDLVVTVELKGTCRECALSSHTFTAGIEETIRKAVPSVSKVLAVNAQN